MPYGLNNFFKKILPKRLFYRSLIIVALPIVLLQLIVTVVFFDSLWIKTNKGMTRALVSEIATFIDAYDNEKTNKDFIIKTFSANLKLNIKYKKDEILPKKLEERWYSPMDRSLRREIKSKNYRYWFDTTSYKELVHIRIAYKNGYFEFFIPKERIAPASARIFALWIILPGLFLITIAIVFLKNQTRPIVNLAKAAESFGKGEFVKGFSPSGAKEIRQAGYEFDKMRKRISVHLNQRSEMLSGISHDLRTPLTRLKLQLALLKQQDLAKKMSDDIEEMERMLNEYLEFSRNQKSEDTETVDINSLIADVVKKYNNKKIKTNFDSDTKIHLRQNTFKRCLGNLIDNSLSYGNEVQVSTKKTIKDLIIFIDDDGPGIPKNEYEKVIKPFYRIDKSRGQNKSGVGLGLSIANDIIRSHGGSISLDESPLNGLRVKISLPF